MPGRLVAHATSISYALLECDSKCNACQHRIVMHCTFTLKPISEIKSPTHVLGVPPPESVPRQQAFGDRHRVGPTHTPSPIDFVAGTTGCDSNCTQKCGTERELHDITAHA
jgi:hypothetical protein